MFEKITLYDNRALSATVRERGKGVESEAETLDDWIEVGAYAKGEDESIYLELRRFDGASDELSIVLDERPSKAGIDPRNLLIGRRATTSALSTGELFFLRRA